MGTLKLDRLPGFLRSRDPSVRLLLVYGPDAGRVGEIARSIVVALAGSDDDPFALTRIGEEDIAADPGRLADEAGSISLGGGTRTVWVRDAGAALARAVPAVLAAPGGLIVAEAGGLARTNALRVLVEASGQALAIPCYEDDARDLRQVVSDMLRGDDLRIEPAAMEVLLARLGTDRAYTRSEIAKLATYCHGRGTVTQEDVEAVCGEGVAGTYDRLADAVMEGNADVAVRTVDELSEAGVPAASLLTGLAGHIARLRALQIAAAAGRGPERAVEAARPPVFFKRRPSLLQQMRLWPLDRLDAAAETVFEAVLRTRRFPQLDRTIAERTVLSLAVGASRHRGRHG